MERTMVRQQNEVFGSDHGLIHEAVITGRSVGAGHKFWAGIAHNKALFSKVMGFVLREGFEVTNSQERARDIMGKNFFGIEEAFEYFGVNPSEKDIAALAEVPFVEETLETLKDTHVLVAVFPMSILDIENMNNSPFLVFSEGQYGFKRFAKRKGIVGWRLVCKTPVDDSTSKILEEQRRLLGENNEIPSARVLIYTIAGYLKSTGVLLFGIVGVRTSCVCLEGSHVTIEPFNSTKLRIGVKFDDNHISNSVGISAVRKPLNLALES